MSNTELPNEVKLRIALVNSILLCDALISNIDKVEKLSNRDDPKLHVWCGKMKTHGLNFQNSMINFMNKQSLLYSEENFNEFNNAMKYREAFLETFISLLSYENVEPMFDVLSYSKEKLSELKIEL